MRRVNGQRRPEDVIKKIFFMEFLFILQKNKMYLTKYAKVYTIADQGLQNPMCPVVRIVLTVQFQGMVAT